jgi:DNA-binding NarL/FixJ family response regulator
MAQKSRPKSRVFLAEEHPLTRESFSELINYQEDLEVCGQSGTVGDTLEAVEKACPDLLIAGISFQNGHGIDLIKDLNTHHPHLPILVYSIHDETLYAERALKAGAKGFVMKHEPLTVLMEAIHQVLKGGTYLSQKMRTRHHRERPATRG